MTSALNASALEARDQEVIVNADSQTQLYSPTTKVYKYRWFILLLFGFSTGLNGFQWIQCSIISNVVQKYYSVPSVYVDWLSISFMFAYIPFAIPAMWLMDKKGLRVITVFGSAINFLAAWIKVMSVRPDLFYVTFIGQTVGGIGQVFVLNAPSRLAAVWFGQDQVSTACGIAVFGNQLGVALGFLMPPILVQNSDDIDQIGAGLSTMFYIIAGICTVHLLLVIMFFRAEPELPPSLAQATRVTETPAFFDSLKRLSKNPGFMLLTFSYGLNVGVIGAISTVLNQVVLSHFPGHEEDAGRIGLTIMVAGMIGSVVCGIILDKTHRFKETSLALYVFAMVWMLVFTFTLDHTTIGVIYAITALLGFCMTGFLSVGYEYTAEITYPEPEGTSAGVINISAIVLSISLTLGASSLLNAVGDLWENVALSASLLIGSICVALIKSDLRRLAAQGERGINVSS